jgi:hypothetical protein
MELELLMARVRDTLGEDAIDQAQGVVTMRAPDGWFLRRDPMWTQTDGLGAAGLIRRSRACSQKN